MSFKNLGIIGGGQLGSMLSDAARKLNIKTVQSTKWGVSDSIAVKTFHELYSKKMSIYEDK